MCSSAAEKGVAVLVLSASKKTPSGEIRDEHPDLWEAACREDEEQRGRICFAVGWACGCITAVCHCEKQILRTDEEVNTVRQCSLGACFV